MVREIKKQVVVNNKYWKKTDGINSVKSSLKSHPLWRTQKPKLSMFWKKIKINSFVRN